MAIIQYWNINLTPDKSNDLYYAFFSSFIQGNLALIAFLGSVAIFQLQNHEMELRDLFRLFLPDNPIRVQNANQKVIDNSLSYGFIVLSDYLKNMYAEVGAVSAEDMRKKGFLERMHVVQRFEWEIRNMVTGLSFITFASVLLVMTFLVLSVLLSSSFGLWMLAITGSLMGIILYDAGHLIRRVVGYSDGRN